MSNYFEKKVDRRSRNAMVDFLTGHYRYFTAKSWNGTTSFANVVMVNRLIRQAVRGNPRTRYLTWRKAWPNTLMFGISCSWCPLDKTLCLMVHVFTHVLLLGPHTSGQ